MGGYARALVRRRAAPAPVRWQRHTIQGWCSLTNIIIINAATGNLGALAQALPREYNRALKGIGYWLKGEIQQGIAAGAPGGLPYRPLAPRRLDHKQHPRTERVRGRLYVVGTLGANRKKPMGRLKAAVRYKYYADSRRVIIGWISPNAELIGTIQETGGTRAVTPKMRRYFWANAVPIGAATSRITIPRRPTIGPERRQHAAEIPSRMQTKIFEYLRGVT